MKFGTLREKLKMYDHIIANFLKGSAIVEPSKQLGIDTIDVGFDTLSSHSYISKYFLVTELPDWLSPRLMDNIRIQCLNAGVKVNFYIYSQRHVIRWDSDEMKNKLAMWKKFSESHGSLDSASAFEYRGKREALLTKMRIINSMNYLNKADLEDKRTLCQVSILIEVSGRRGANGEYLYNMGESIKALKGYCNTNDIKLREIKVNVIDWLQSLSPLSLKSIKEVNQKISKRVMTDDILANMNSYKQGKIGVRGIPIGIDVSSKLPVLRDFKANKDSAENWLVSAATGGGKSYFVKHLLFWLIGCGITVTVVDFEGDEYIDFAKYVKSTNPNDAVIVSMGKGSAYYCDPMEIPDLTGVKSVDEELKETAIGYTFRLFTVLVKGAEGGELDKWQTGVINEAIRNVYDNAGVTDDSSTWYKSKGLRLHDVFEEIQLAVKRKQGIDEDMGNVKYRAAVDILESCIPYFVDGESKSGTFKNPLPLETLLQAKYIVFSFGEKGKATMEADPVMLQLKQLSVANISGQISNYHKYVKKGINAKVWEEYQRWMEIEGSANIIKNVITGGRKRGDFNIIITNDLSSILDDDGFAGKINRTIRQNITSYCIGRIKDVTTVNRFCTTFKLQELEPQLTLISEATKRSKSRYYRAFCIVMDDSEKAVVKVMLPASISKSELYSTNRGEDEEIKE